MRAIEVQAAGTEFVVRRDDHQLAVTLLEGEIRVAEPSADAPATFDRLAEPTVLVPGQRLTPADRAKLAIDQPAMDVVTAWRRGNVVLDKTPLSSAAAEMNRYSEAQIVIEGTRAQTIELGGVFRAGDSAQFPHAVAESYGLRLSSKDN